MNWLSAVFQTLVGVGGLGGITALFMARQQQHRINAETGKLSAEAEVALSAEARHWVALLYARAEAAEKRADDAVAQVQECQKRVALLVSQVEFLRDYLRDQGMDQPAFPPPLRLG